MATNGVNGMAVAAAGAGALLIWSGLKGASISGSLRSLISGQGPSSADVNPIFQLSGAGFSSQGISGSPLAQDLLNWVGKAPYKWGGANPNGWDCSGAVNYVANHDQGLPIPGYSKGHTFTGKSHGPPTLVWLAWAPANMLRISSANVQAGDLVIWQTHMGIALDNIRYVSAFDSAEGTVVHNIHGGGPIGEVATYWRYKFGTPGSQNQNPNPLTGVTT